MNGTHRNNDPPMGELEARRHDVEELRDEEILEMIRDLVPALNKLGDRLEQYVRGREPYEDSRDTGA
jgi:hypothetical protein